MRRIQFLIAVLTIAAIACFAACGDDSSEGDNDNAGLNIGEGPPNSDDNINHPNYLPPTPPAIEFVMRNTGDDAVFIQAATEPGPGWLSVMFEDDDEPLHILWDCGLPCQCAEEGEVASCQDCGMMPPHPQQLEAGGEVRQYWEGTYRNVIGEGMDRCFEEVLLFHEPMRAEFCYGSHPGDDDPEGYIVDVQCETVDFHLGLDDIVEVEINDESEPSPPLEEPEIDFVIENESSDSIFVQRATLPAPGWLTITLDGDEVHPLYDCGLPCPCDEELGCAVCDMMPPYVEEISPGSEIRRQWDGIDHRTMEEGCFEKIQLYEEAMEAQLCYGYDYTSDEMQEMLDDPICETINFELGADDEVVVTVL